MYGLIRLIISCIIFAFFFLVTRKNGVRYKRTKRIIAVVVAVVLVTILCFFPFENLFITFNSPESVYEYVNGMDSDVETVIEGKNSDLVLGNKGDSHILFVVPKDINGWKIGVGSDVKIIDQTIYNDYVIYVYEYKNQNDFYITVLNTNSGYLEVTDSCNSLFVPIEKANDALGEFYITYYANISNFNNEYWIKVDGHKINPMNTR